MQITQSMRCPNCGSQAIRHHLSDRLPQTLRCPDNRALQTECPACDYLMVMCTLNGAVVEAYAPGISMESYAGRHRSGLPQPRPERWAQPMVQQRAITSPLAMR